MKLIRKHANFVLACPFPKGNHTITNVVLNDSYVPKLFSSLHFRIFLYLSAQVPGFKSMKEILNMYVTGELDR